MQSKSNPTVDQGNYGQYSDSTCYNINIPQVILPSSSSVREEEGLENTVQRNYHYRLAHLGFHK